MKNIAPGMIPGTNRCFRGMNCSLSRLRKQYFGGERSVLAVAADISVQPLHDGVDANQAEAMPLALGAAEQLYPPSGIFFPAVKLVKEI